MEPHAARAQPAEPRHTAQPRAPSAEAYFDSFEHGFQRTAVGRIIPRPVLEYPPMLANLLRYRRYIWTNALASLRVRYAGSGMGVTWNILLPLLQILVYTVIFSRLVSLRSDLVANNPHAFILYLCSGLLPWIAFSNSVRTGSRAFRANSRYLQRLAIPEEIFVAQSSVADTLGLFVYLVMLVGAGIALGKMPDWPGLLMPVVAVLFLLFAFGLGLLMASLVVFFQDLSQILSVLLGVWMWTLPIIWSETMLPPEAIRILQWNPGYFYIRGFRQLFLEGQIPGPMEWGVMLAWAVGFTLLGALVLKRLRADLRDAL